MNFRPRLIFRHSLLRCITGVLLLALVTGEPLAIAPTSSLEEQLTREKNEWTQANYELPENQRSDFLASLQNRAHALSLTYPDHAEPLVWEGIITATHAKYQNPFSALSSAREARDLLLHAIAINPAVMDGSALVTLGALYARVPKLGSFGDDDKARLYLKQALTLDPNNIDANYFYGKFLLEQGDKQQATFFMKKAV